MQSVNHELAHLSDEALVLLAAPVERACGAPAPARAPIFTAQA